MSLAEQIAFLTNPTPVFHDPEDDQDKETRAKVADFDDELEENEEIVSDVDRLRRSKKQEEHSGGRSKLRLRNAALLDEEDKRYAGKKISRKELVKEDDDDDEEESENDETESEYDSEIERFKRQMGLIPSDISTSHLDEDSSEGEREEQDEEEDKERSEGDEQQEKEEAEVEKEIDEKKAEEEVRHFSQMHLDEDAKKGNAIKSQLGLWDSLLESRIKLQKVMMVTNQLPQHDVWQTFNEKGGQDFKIASRQSQKKIENLLNTLVNLQDILFARNVETKFILNSEKGEVVSKPKESTSSDEEIPSDTEDEAEELKDKEGDKDEEQPKIKKRKLKSYEYPEFIKKRHSNFEHFRNATIQKWNERTKLTAGKLNKSFAGFEQSALKQIEHILSDKERLIKRTQMKRNAYIILGKTIETESGESKEGEDNYDEEIFDDNDFYHQLLRDLIERRTVNVNDPVALGRQWLQIQKLRSKLKRKVDTRASKGRKIRYDVHAKLVNFMAPVDTTFITDEAKDELFNSLFGEKK